MGVTTHWFAFDPNTCPATTTVSGFAERRLLADDQTVLPTGEGRIAAVPSWLEPNKRWYRNIDAEWAWTRAREAVPEDVRPALDRWFGHLFWSGETGCDCGRAPEAVAPDEVVYRADLIAHVLDLAVPLDPVADALDVTFAAGAPAHASYPWMYESDGFTTLVRGWQATLSHAARWHPGWSLLRWVWI